ncbi:hypothetical protein R5W23_002779 [Gemmata sp. JC673]|uniref:Uncharacterized protein n=1 Tax=Gemmata algarum TaxID=2975278 RepID=A0ABU5F1P4_9BACT|nr:hypothetical protein [Gemmata algarum]MDY3561501.1 hypothetical protein [Gemmata algarum]
MNPDSDTLWREGDDPLALLEDLYPPSTLGSGQHQVRQCRLYLVACARRQWQRLPGVCRGLVELAEYYADRPREREPLRAALEPIAEGLMGSDGAEEDLGIAGAALGAAKRTLLGPDHLKLSADHAGGRELEPSVGDDEWRGLAALVYLPFMLQTPPFRWVPRELHSTALLREVYYNPYRFVPFPAAWRTSDVLGVARAVYDSNDFGQMPVLGDALEDAGCDSAEILNHCRHAPAESHARGCWVLDRILQRGRNRG